MSILIIIPAHNEATNIQQCIDSLIQQSKQPDKLIIVNDNSTDTTSAIIKSYLKNYDFIELVENFGESTHLPGAKVINTFYKGLSKVAIDDYDIICKFDADIIFPENYLEIISTHYKNNSKLGMCSGLCYIKNVEEEWVYENIASKKHVRGPIKSYSTACFKKIDGLRKSIGWDTVDELLAIYYGFHIETIPELHVKHLRPTGRSYTKKAKLLQGEAMYRMRYRLFLTCIASAKMAFQQKRCATFLNNLKGYLKCKKEKTPYIVTKQEGAFIRNYRYKGIIKKFIP